MGSELKRDVLFQDFLIKEETQWKFNLSRASWWGRQFERMVGLVKKSIYKDIQVTRDTFGHRDKSIKTCPLT